MEIKFNTNNYNLLSWRGIGDGLTKLTPNFNINYLQNKIITIKSFQIFPYNGEGDMGAGVKLFNWNNLGSGDVFEIDNITAGQVRIPNFYKEAMYFGGVANPIRSIQLFINNEMLDCFPTFGLPLDFKLDNMLIRHPSPLRSIDLMVLANNYIDYNTQTQEIPWLYVFMEIYKEDPINVNKTNVITQ
jgi:hypothetical protein